MARLNQPAPTVTSTKHTESTLKSIDLLERLESVEVTTTCNHCNYDLCHCNCNFVVVTEGSTQSTWVIVLPTQPNVLRGKSFKFTIRLHCFIPPT